MKEHALPAQAITFVIAKNRACFEEFLVVFDQVVFKGMDERLEFYLKNQFESSKENILSITHQEIANDLNTSQEVVSRLLKKNGAGQKNQAVKK